MNCVVDGCSAVLGKYNRSGYCEAHRNLCPRHKASKAAWAARNIPKSTRKVMTPAERRSRRASLRIGWDSTFSRVKVTAEEYASLVLAQDGKCAICSRTAHEDFRGRLAVDHCHSSGKVRGLLCHPCNLMLGHAKDKQEVLKRAAEYLRQNELGEPAENGHNEATNEDKLDLL